MKIEARIHLKNHELAAKRKDAGFTCAEFAKKVGVSMGIYRKIENLHRTPTEEEIVLISTALNIPTDVIFPEGHEKVVAALGTKNRQTIVEYTAPLLDSADQELRLLEQSNAKITVEKLIVAAGMSPREAEIVILRSGLNGNPPLTLEETAKQFGVTRERIRQMEAKAHERMRNAASRAYDNGQLAVDDLM